MIPNNEIPTTKYFVGLHTSTHSAIKMEAKIREMIKDGDILFFRNGNKTTFYEMDRWKFSEFYDENLLFGNSVRNY